MTKTLKDGTLKVTDPQVDDKLVTAQSTGNKVQTSAGTDTGNKVQTTSGGIHKFKPQEGITPYELAEIVEAVLKIRLSDDDFAKLPVEAQRHFKTKDAS